MTDPRRVQLVSGCATLVVDSTVNGAPGVLVKENWKVPPTIAKPVSLGGVAAGNVVVKVRSAPAVAPALFEATTRK